MLSALLSIQFPIPFAQSFHRHFFSFLNHCKHTTHPLTSSHIHPSILPSILSFSRFPFIPCHTMSCHVLMTDATQHSIEQKSRVQHGITSWSPYQILTFPPIPSPLLLSDPNAHTHTHTATALYCTALHRNASSPVLLPLNKLRTINNK